MTDDFQQYSAFIKEQLEAEAGRRDSFNARGEKLQQTAGVLIGLLIPTWGFLRSRASTFPGIADCAYGIAVVVLLGVIALGIWSTQLGTVQVADEASFIKMLGEHKEDEALTARLSIARTHLTTLTSLRICNDRTATKLTWAMWLEMGTLLLGTFATIVAGVSIMSQ